MVVNNSAAGWPVLRGCQTFEVMTGPEEKSERGDGFLLKCMNEMNGLGQAYLVCNVLYWT